MLSQKILNMTGIEKLINNVITDKKLRRPIVAKSLIATIFGDIIESYGGRIWLGNLIQLVQLFGINERLLRTSVYRLTEEGWLTKTRKGRRSIYGLSREGKEQTALAHNLIYRNDQKTWNGVWNIVVASGEDIPATRLIQLQHRLSLMGFGVLSKNIFAHPDMDDELVNNVIRELGLEKRVPVMRSQTINFRNEIHGAGLNRELVKLCCPYTEADTLYRHFIAAYRPLYALLSKKKPVTDEACFRIRVLLIHDYRRLLFKDPQLPDELLPPDWSGKIAGDMVRELYFLTWKQANHYYLEECKDNVIRPRLKREFFTRFGGLVDTLAGKECRNV